MARKAAAEVTPTFPIGSRRGFTLLELLVTLVIMVIMTGVVATAIAPALEDAHLRAGTRMVISQLRYARSYAVSHHTQAMVRFTSEPSRVSVQALEQGDDGEQTWDAVTTPAGRLRKLPTGVTFTVAGEGEVVDTKDEPTVTFSMLGQTEESMTITLHGANGRQRIIRLDALSGQTTLAEDQL